MDQILRFLLKFFPFLWKEFGFRFVDSMYSPSQGGDSYVVLQSDTLRLMITRDKGQLFLDIQSSSSDSEEEWYDVHLLWELLTGEIRRSAELDEKYAQFLRSNLENIAELFNEKNIENTKRRTREIKERRANRFGVG